MIIAVGAVALLVLIILFLRYLEDRVEEIAEEHTERISTLEVKDTAHGARLDNHQKILALHSKDLKELGADVGWDEGKRVTQMLDIPVTRDDDSED
jgi:hypothetical protein